MTTVERANGRSWAHLHRQVARLRLAYGRLGAENRRQRERAAALVEQARASRDVRWLARYEKARSRHERLLRGMLDGRPGDARS